MDGTEPTPAQLRKRRELLARRSVPWPHQSLHDLAAYARAASRLLNVRQLVVERSWEAQAEQHDITIAQLRVAVTAFEDAARQFRAYHEERAQINAAIAAAEKRVEATA